MSLSPDVRVLHLGFLGVWLSVHRYSQCHLIQQSSATNDVAPSQLYFTSVSHMNTKVYAPRYHLLVLVRPLLDCIPVEEIIMVMWPVFVLSNCKGRVHRELRKALLMGNDAHLPTSAGRSGKFTRLMMGKKILYPHLHARATTPRQEHRAMQLFGCHVT